MKEKVKALWAPVLAVLLTAAFPAVFLYCQNAEEAAFGEMVPALLIFAGVGMVLFLLSFLLLRKADVAAIVAVVFILILTNFALVEKVLNQLFPWMRYWHAVPIILFLGFHIAWAAWKLLPEDMTRDIVRVLCLVFGVLILINLATGAPGMIRYAQAQQKLREVREQRIEAATDRPNVYLLMFDEYANFPQMEEYYHYDNAPLKDFLEGHNFAIAYQGHNDSIMSTTVQTNLVNMDYVVSNTTPGPEKDTLRKRDAALFSLMRERGYDVRLFETKDFYGGYNPAGGEVNTAALTINGENLLDIAVQRTVVYPFWTKENTQAIQEIEDMTDYLSDPANIPAGGTFTLAYYCFPHQPFLADADGNYVATEGWANWEDDRYYLGQYQYATKLMLQILNNLVKNDPNSVILLMSDHGARASTSPSYMEKFPLEVMNNSLNAVYYQGEEKLDIDGLSVVNTLRTVLNRLFDLDYEMLPVPEDTYKYK